MSTAYVLIESFSSPKFSWETMNDPVMGGKSYSQFSIKDDVGIFDGEVVDVPFLKAPGFITMRGNGDYPDVSYCNSLQLRLRASEQYSGYKISFGNRHIHGNRHAYGYKADFHAPVGDEMMTVTIPFRDFTARWDEATGDPIVTCQENPDYCPDQETLKNMKTLSIWGEGVCGDVHLEVESISASDCDYSTLNTLTNGSSSVSPKKFSDVASSLVTFAFIVLVLITIISLVKKKFEKEKDYIPIKGCTSGLTSV